MITKVIPLRKPLSGSLLETWARFCCLRASGHAMLAAQIKCFLSDNETFYIHFGIDLLVYIASKASSQHMRTDNQVLRKGEEIHGR